MKGRVNYFPSLIHYCVYFVIFICYMSESLMVSYLMFPHGDLVSWTCVKGQLLKPNLLLPQTGHVNMQKNNYSERVIS